MWSQALLVCYFLGLVAALLKTVRYALDAKRYQQRFYLIGIPANLAPAAALLVLAASTGNTFHGDWLRSAIRLSFIVWAVLALLFEAIYLKTILSVRGSGMTDQSEIQENSGNE